MLNSLSGSKSSSDEPLWIQLLAAVICILSILGSLAIILTYVMVKDIRSKARELLVHISLMDIMYSTANLVGLTLPYREHLDDSTKNTSSTAYQTYDRICQAQAAIGLYGTIGSVLWTLGLAVYLYYRIVSRDDTVTKWVLRVLYVVCYTLPLFPTLWLLLADKLGYWLHAPVTGGGWCSVKENIEPLVNFMTFDVWIWLGVILIPLYISIHVSIREEIHQYNKKQDHQLVVMSSPTFGRKELKLLFVPVVFIILRVWDVVSSTLYVYCDSCRPHHQVFWLQLFQAIGDSGQGIFNFIIFFLFQPKLRALLMQGICCCNKSKCRQPPVYHDDDNGEDDDEMDDTTSLQYRNRASSQFSQYTT